jgi:hypothetical protein
VTLYEELFKIVESHGFQPQLEGQTDEQYLMSLLIAVGSIPEDEWDVLCKERKLSKAAIDWYNTTAELVNNKVPFVQWPKLDGFKGPAPFIPKKVAADTKKRRVVKTIRSMLMMRPEMMSREVWKYLDATSFPGIKFDMVSVICSETRSFILLAKELGFWREKSKYEGEAPLTEEEQKLLESTVQNEQESRSEV